MKWMGIVLLAIMFSVTMYGQTTSQKQLRESFWTIYTDALRGVPVAQYETGVIFERGIGVERNETKAAEWYEKAASQGHIDAQYNIAIMYATGRGIDRNETRAVEWLSAAAKQGDVESKQLLQTLIADKRKGLKEQTITEHGEDRGEESIVPVTLICKDSCVVCSGYGDTGECSPYKEKTVVTSKSKRGNYYRISGIVINRKWQEYKKEGWIQDISVEIRR